MTKELRKTGRLMRGTGYHAFIPDPLPPRMEFTPSLLRSLSDADRLLGQLAGAWEPWIEYFLNGVARMSEDVVSRAARINDLLVQWRKATVGSQSKLPLQLVDLLAENPYWTAKKIAQRAGVAFTTAQRGIDKLVSLGVLSPVTDAQRDRVYCAKKS